MTLRWLGLSLLVAAVVTLLVVKSSSKTTSAPAPAAPGVPRVLLWADLREAEDACVCGEIIRTVRAAANRGVVTRENDDALGKEHRVTVEPTVIVLDAQGREEARYEGEESSTLTKIRDHLTKVPSATP